MTDVLNSDVDWDLSADYSLFNLEADLNFAGSTPEGGVPQSLPSPAEDNASSVVSTTNSLVTRMIQSNSNAVYAAFQRSAGRWDPEQCYYRASEESHLSLGRVAPTNLDCLGRWDPALFSQTLSSSIRDHILAAIVRSCDQANMAAAATAFPTAEMLDRLSKAFHTRHASSTDSWIHVPTFQLKEARLELLVASISSAAACSSHRTVQKFGLAMQEFLVYQLWAVVRTRSSGDHKLKNLADPNP